MMKYGLACMLGAAGLIDSAEARVRTTWAQKRVDATKIRLERNFGRGLTGLINENGHVDPDRLGWMTDLNGRKPLGSNINVTIMPGLTLNASTTNALVLGFVQGLQYNGLARDDQAILPVDTVALTNCFASTYALLEDFEVSSYNISTFSSEPGTLKIFDVLGLDPAHILMDLTVEWEMCDGEGILTQFKNMFSGDQAAVADNLTRELLVIFLESPEDRKTIQDIYAAGKCAKTVADESGLADDAQAAANSEEDPAFWDSFAADPLDTANQAGACADNVDRYRAGKISGRLFASFWGQQLKAN